MGFVIQIAPGKAEARAVVWAYPVGPTTQPGAIWARIPRSRSARHGLVPRQPGHGGDPPTAAPAGPGRRPRRREVHRGERDGSATSSTLSAHIKPSMTECRRLPTLDAEALGPIWRISRE